MKEINRRDVLKGLGVVSAAGLTSQVACHNQQQPTQPQAISPKAVVPPGTLLNIVLHGTYAIILEHGKNGKSVTLKAPFVSDHVYYAATADLDAAGEVIWRQTSWIFQNTSFAVDIQGSSSSMAVPNPASLQTDRVIIDWDLSKIKGYDIHNPPYHSVSLPWPDGIYPLRADHKNTLTGQTLKDNNVAPKQIPTVYVLAYKFATYNTPTFKDNLGFDRPIPVGSDGVMRLHLFAEPRDHGDCAVPNMALDALRRLFIRETGTLDLSLVVKNNAAVPPDVTGMPTGVDHCEERSTGELSIPCSKFMGYTAAAKKVEDGRATTDNTDTICTDSGHPRNCMAVIINSSIS
jgi:hypothetical protein